ncbi:uncharacterized protein SCHCODRAFT_02733866 [Schizophyllum commune H4-8]|uniref:uncharacterized protein n=1 Tax=Schizophyllum commune (strain H4-8 / FGSC 9210) TaxID=578458 RepID=UPI00215E5744|nr:uncharacterized protein SCHCODRAFT_02733866 [Schizophyllum commune H4-8]KAI5892731.1 hypothetical protein SCHCODRAFT_02733866 [Schizophyllum commune H4-8]
MAELNDRCSLLYELLFRVFELLAHSGVKAADLWQRFRRVSDLLSLHISDASAAASACDKVINHIWYSFKLNESSKVNFDTNDFNPVFGPLDSLVDIGALILALDALHSSMCTHLVYLHGLNRLVYEGLVPLVRGRKSLPLSFHRADAILRGLPSLERMRELVRANSATAAQWKSAWRRTARHFRAEMIPRIRRMPWDVMVGVTRPIGRARMYACQQRLDLM